MQQVPEAASNDVDDAVFLASSYGLTPDEWQEVVLAGWLGVRADGKWAASRNGLAVPRQNGKNGVVEVRELHGMVSLGERILHTAHEVKTARKAFARLLGFFDNWREYPDLHDLVKEIRRTNGQEAIVLHNGGSVEFIARSKSSGRGYSVDVLVLDEAQELDDDALAALLPTISASANPQTIYTGTPPGPSANGEVFSRVRAAGLDGSDPRLCWMEWGCDPGADLDDRQAWAQANPALGIRIYEETVADERSAMDDAMFGRERCGLWDSAASKGVIPGQSWTDQADERSIAVDRFALGVECGPDLAWASVALAGQREDGDWHFELDDDQHTRGRGTAWLVPHLESMVKHNPQIRAVVVDVAGPIAALLEKRNERWFFKGTRLEVTPVKVAELGAGCSRVLDGIVTGWLHHIGQPQFTSAALSAGKRALGDTGMWVWSRKAAESDITPIQAATLALIGAQASKVRKPQRQASGERRAVIL